MNANFLRLVGITTLSLLLAARVALPAAPADSQTQNGRERPIAVESTPTLTPTPIPNGQCNVTVCG
jgi:hypothetical protein